MAYAFAQHFIYTEILSALLVLKVYTRTLGTNGSFVFQEQQVLTRLSSLASTIVVNAFIDLVEHDVPWGAEPLNKNLSRFFFYGTVLYSDLEVDIYQDKFLI